MLGAAVQAFFRVPIVLTTGMYIVPMDTLRRSGVCATLILRSCFAETREAEAIRSVSQELSRAFETRKLEKVPDLFIRDFRCQLPTGTTLTREQFLQTFAEQSERALPPVSVVTNLIRLSVQGATGQGPNGRKPLSTR